MLSFLNLILKFWKVLNVHGPYDDLRYRDPLRTTARSVECGNLKLQVGFAEILRKMHPNTVKRMKSLTKYASRGLSHICRGLVGLAKQFPYVMLGLFPSNPFEKQFVELP